MAFMKSRWQRRTAITAGVVAVLLIALAFIPGMFLRGIMSDQLEQRGLRAEGLEDVRFNVFNLSAETGPVEIWRGDQQVIALDGLELFLRLTPLLRQHIDVGGAKLHGLKLSVAADVAGAVSVQGLPALEGDGEGEGSGWLLGLTRVALEDSEIALDLPQISGTVALDSLELVNFKTWTPENPGTLSFRAGFEGARLSGRGSASPFGDDIEATFDLTVEDFPLDRVAVKPALAGTLAADVKGRAVVGADTAVTASGNVGGANLATRLDDQTAVAVDQLGLTVESLELVQDEGVKVTAKIEADVAGAQATLAGEGESLIVAVGAYEGPLTLVMSQGDEVALSAEGGSRLESVSAGLSGGGQLIGAGSAEVSAWSLAADGALQAGLVRLGGLVGLIEAEAPLASIGSLTLRDVAVAADGGITVASAALSGAALDARRSEAGFEGLALIDRLPQGGEPESDSAPTSIAIGMIGLADSAKITFNDQSLPVPVTHHAEVEQLDVKGLDTGAPGNRASLTVKAKFNEQAALDFAGWIAPFDAPEASFDLAGAFEGLELHNLSPYAASALGVNLRSGRLDVVFDGASDRGALNANGHWVIRKIELEELDDFEQANLSEAADVPIDTAINLLQDKEGTIEFDVPIVGSLGDPEFDLSLVINKAIGKAIGNAVKTTLKVVFPVMLLADIGGGKGKNLKFDPVLFAPQGDEVSDEARAHLQSVVGLLAERPKLSIKYCGLAVHEDFRAARVAAQGQQFTADEAAAAAAGAEAPPPPDPLAEPITEEERAALMELAQRRTDAVKEALVGGLGVDPERVFECRAKLDLETGGDPRAELSI